MAIISTPKSEIFRLRLNAGSSGTGTTLTRTQNLFSSSLTKASLDASALQAAFTLSELLEPLLVYSLNSLETQSVATITSDE